MNKKYGIIALAISVAFVVSSGAFLLASENGTSEISTVTFELKEKKANTPGKGNGPPPGKGGGNGGGGGKDI
ncbi:hypothetical protein AKJ41_02085 [candidate division MSBL1 archaeon SCGC-AAA259O05]|uniref:Uncharacterized protein n=1 Tax=candidate division MSBL1 archaeon SCGC-AAA259O05 TaxID=1698271 RepID=A0A133V4E7_9EURY|nr:hypothetical protein AKJ41_02085 [candidate division MSBL1 archaeon SCGC-AAA259O05]